MLYKETLLIYGVLGCGVAVAWRHYRAAAPGNIWECFAAVAFWPLFVPVLLSPAGAGEQVGLATSASEPPPGLPLRAVVDQTTQELMTAIHGASPMLIGNNAGVAAVVQELQHAWSDLAARIESMDQAIAEDARHWNASVTKSDQAVWDQSEAVRKKNLTELRSLREQVHHALLVSLLQVRELIPLIHVARYGDSSADRLPELIAQIAAAIPAVKPVG